MNPKKAVMSSKKAGKSFSFIILFVCFLSKSTAKLRKKAFSGKKYAVNLLLNADIMLNLHKTFRIEHLYLFVRNSAKVLQQAMDGQVSMTLGKVFVVGNATFVSVARHNPNS